MFTPRFDAVRELEEWISTIKFTYVGSSPNKAASATHAVELSNKEDKNRQQQQQENNKSSEDNNNDHNTSSMSEQLVEILVKVLQTGLRPGLRGSLEVIKVLDRLPEIIYVPVPNASFTATQLEKASRWFKSEESFQEFFEERENNKKEAHGGTANNNIGFMSQLPPPSTSSSVFMELSDPESFDLVPLPMKFIRSSLFVVNSAASSALSPDKNSAGKQQDTSLPKTAAAQLRMFFRICLQQRCILAVFELLMGYLKGSSDSAGSLSEFLYVHPTASPLLDEMAFPQVMDCLRKFGGPPLVVRAAAHENNLSIGPLLESPWDPEVAASISSDSPLTASWSMWFATKGLRLKWAMEYNLPKDNEFPDYVVVESSSASGLMSLSAPKSGGNNNNNNNNNNLNVYDEETGSVTGRTDGGGGRRVIRRIVKKKGGGSTSRTTPMTSPAGDNTTGGAITPQQQAQYSGRNNNNNNNNNQLPPISPGGNYHHHQRNPSSLGGESPRPNLSSNTPQGGSSARGHYNNNKSVSITPPASVRGNRTEVYHTDPSTTATSQQQQPPEFEFTSQETVDKNIKMIKDKEKKELAFVDETIAKWKSNSETFQSTVSETVQPLLEAYAVLVYTKYSAALGKSNLSENRLMECHDQDAGVDPEIIDDLLTDDYTTSDENDEKDDDDDSADEFETAKNPIKSETPKGQVHENKDDDDDDEGLEW